MIIIGATNLAKELGISRITVYTYIKEGMPHHRKSERKIIFDLDEVKEWLKKSCRA